MSIEQTKSPSTCASDSVDGGTAWDSVSSATATSGDGATCTLLAGATSQWLVCTNCAFAIPSGAAIEGNTPAFEHWASLLSTVKVTSLRLVNGNVKQSVEAVVLPVFSLLSVVEDVLGGATTLLASEVSQANVIDSGYGIAIRVQNQGILPATIHVRKVELKVSYLLPIVHPMTGVIVW